MKKIAVKRSDGGVEIIVPTHEATEETMLRDALAVDGYVSHREIDEDHLPQDRTFRNAWTDDNPTETVDIDSVKAKEIHKERLRELRAPKLAALDIEYQKADEQGDVAKKTEIAAKKQQLRDITKAKFSDDPDVLKTQIPEALA